MVRFVLYFLSLLHIRIFITNQDLHVKVDINQTIKAITKMYLLLSFLSVISFLVILSIFSKNSLKGLLAFE